MYDIYLHAIYIYIYIINIFIIFVQMKKLNWYGFRMLPSLQVRMFWEWRHVESARDFAKALCEVKENRLGPLLARCSKAEMEEGTPAAGEELVALEEKTERGAKGPHADSKDFFLGVSVEILIIWNQIWKGTQDESSSFSRTKKDSYLHKPSQVHEVSSNRFRAGVDGPELAESGTIDLYLFDRRP